MSYNGSGTFVINTAGQPVVSGTVISSTAFNALTADLATGLSTAITKDGQTTPTANIPMGNNKITGLAVGTAATDAANLSQVQSTVSKLINSVSGADTITGTMSPTLGAYATGQMFYFVAAGTNTGAVTLNIDSLGAKAVTRDGSTALTAGDLRSGEVIVVVYDGTRFQVVSQVNSGGDATFANVSITSALNVGGVATFTGNPVLSGGTANGVLYLNGSKVATSGSALTFDGTSLNAGSAVFPSGRIRLKQPDDTTKQKGLIIEAAADDSILAVGYDGTCFTYNATYNSTGGYKPQAWWVSGSEAMRLTSTGLGIGTSSPASRLTIYDNAPAFTMQTSRSFTTNRNWQIGVDTFTEGNWTLTPSTTLGGNTYTTPALTVNPSGNLGLGVTPSAWVTYKAFQTTGSASFSASPAGAGTAFLTHNGYYDGSNWKYLDTTLASQYRQTLGVHSWWNAASGTAGNTITFTQAMTLDASGNLGVGATTSNGKLTIKNPSTSGEQNIINIQNGGSTGSIARLSYNQTDDTMRLYNETATGTLLFGTNNTERARITSGGSLLVGSTTDSGYHRFNRSNTSDWICAFANTSATTPWGITLNYSAAAPNNTSAAFTFSDNAAERATIRNNGGLANYQANDVNLSDQRVKKDVKPLGSMWDKFKAIEIVTFKYKDQTHDDDNIGVIAQQVESVAPEFIDVDGFGETPEDGVPLKTVYTTDMYHAAIKALQEAMARIEQLEAKVAALETK